MFIQQHMVELFTAAGIDTGLRNARGWWQMSGFFLSASYKYTCNKLHKRLVRKYEYMCLFSEIHWLLTIVQEEAQ
jgi:hypothetical protein